MRFLKRSHRSKLRRPITKLPTARTVDELTYEAMIPRLFISNKIQVYCKDPSKIKLAGRALQQWQKEKGVRDVKLDKNKVGAEKKNRPQAPPVTPDSEEEDTNDSGTDDERMKAPRKRLRFDEG